MYQFCTEETSSPCLQTDHVHLHITMGTERETAGFFGHSEAWKGARAGVKAQKSLGELGLLLLLLGGSGKGALPLETTTSHTSVPAHAAVVPKLGM